MEGLKPIQILGLSSAALFLFIYIPMIIYFAYRFQACRERTAVRRRFPRIVLLMTLISCGWMASSPLQILVLWFGYKYLRSYYTISYLICHILFSYSFLWRFWLIHFQLNYSKQLSRTKWWYVIDPSLSQRQISNSWFMKSKNERFGDIGFTSKIFLAVCILSLFLFFGSDIINLGFWGWLLRASIYSIPWIIMIFLYYKEKKLNDIHDSIHIRKEQKYVLNGYGLLFIVYCLIQICVAVLYKIDKIHDNHLNIITNTFYGFFLHVFELNLFTVCLCINYWPLKVNNINASDPLQRWNDRIKPVFLKDESKFGRRLEFIEMCEDKHKFEVLMDHCIKERQEENLYCLIEVLQFKRALLKYLKSFTKYDDINTESLQDAVTFYPNMHISTLVKHNCLTEIPKYLYTVDVTDVKRNDSEAKIVLEKSKDIVRSINTHRPSNLTYARDTEPIRFKIIAWKLWEKYIKQKDSSVTNMQINFVQQTIIDKLNDLFARYGDYMRRKITRNFMQKTLFHIYDEVIAKLRENITNNIRVANPDDLPADFFEGM